MKKQISRKVNELAEKVMPNGMFNKLLLNYKDFYLKKDSEFLEKRILYEKSNRLTYTVFKLECGNIRLHGERIINYATYAEDTYHRSINDAEQYNAEFAKAGVKNNG